MAFAARLLLFSFALETSPLMVTLEVFFTLALELFVLVLELLELWLVGFITGVGLFVTGWL